MDFSRESATLDRMTSPFHGDDEGSNPSGDARFSAPDPADVTENVAASGTRRWALRQLPREQIGTREVFATRSCCGPGGVGPCISAAEGLPCGVALMPLFAPVPDSVRERGQELRATRLGLSLSLEDAADGLGLRVSHVSMLESGRLDVDDWDALRADLRALRETSDA